MKTNSSDKLSEDKATQTNRKTLETVALDDLMHSVDEARIGAEVYSLIEALYPICRSITGNGVRETLAMLKKHIPLKVYEVPTGTQVFDWTVPKEWNIRDAFIKNSKGERVVDFNQNNLHVVGYSIPVHQISTLAELKDHLFSMPEHPDWIPNRTSYYKETWGFCLTHNQLLSLKDEDYEICIDSTLEPGSLTYGEYLINGTSQEEILIFTHTCHPSMCNDNLSGIALATYLANYLSNYSLRYSYRFVFAPTTIGSITWLSINKANLAKIKYGLNIALCGDSGKLTYKKTRQGNAEIDSVVLHVLQESMKDYEVLEFSPYGYDERQFCSPGINLSVGRLTRSANDSYPEYHTSADNLNIVDSVYLGDFFATCLAIVGTLESNQRYVNRNPCCEPQLGRRGLYKSVGGRTVVQNSQMALLWVLNLSDGANTLLDIAQRSELEFSAITTAAEELEKCGLLEVAE